MARISINTTEFDVDMFGLVHEVDTRRYYDANTGESWQNASGRRVALTSWEEFGSDRRLALVAAENWRRKAQSAWDTYLERYGVPELD